jgi:selenocysteine lyase/cysteine desulfurase
VIYLNNAGTSCPRPPEVGAAVWRVQHADPREWPGLLNEAHTEIASFFGILNPDRLLLTPGCTAGLAVALADLPWKGGDRVLTSHLEHHALVRPIHALVRDRGVHHILAPYRPGSPIDLDFVEARLREGGVRLVAVCAASNVTGELLPVSELVALAHAHGALCLVDAAQTAGTLPIDAPALDVDILVFAGHKGPLGPQGIGGLYLAPSVELASPAASCDLRARTAEACSTFPSYCDVGSVNLAGAAGLAAGLRFLGERGLGAVRAQLEIITQRFLTGLQDIAGLQAYGDGPIQKRTATVSLTLSGRSAEDLERRLVRDYGIVARAGYHCAPLAHEAIGTSREGTLRISFGAFSREDDADAALDALSRLVRTLRG